MVFWLALLGRLLEIESLLIFYTGSSFVSRNSLSPLPPRHHTVSAAWDGEGAGTPGREEEESWNSLFEGLQKNHNTYNFHFHEEKNANHFYLQQTQKVSTKHTFLF